MPSALAKGEGGEQSLRLYLLWWLERMLHAQREIEQTQHCLGTYDVYDCAGVSWEQCEMSALRVMQRCVSLGTQHYPENLYRCFVINAPKWASFVWGMLKTVLNERTREKIVIASGVPDSLRDALGGEEALQKVLDSVPSKLPLKGWCAVDVQDTAEVARAHNRAGACEGAPETTPMVV